MATVWGVVGLDVAVPTGAAWAPGHWEGLQKADHHRGFSRGLQARVREFRERRELLTQIIETEMFYNSQVRVGRVSSPIRERSQLARAFTHVFSAVC